MVSATFPHDRGDIVRQQRLSAWGGAIDAFALSVPGVERLRAAAGRCAGAVQVHRERGGRNRPSLGERAERVDHHPRVGHGHGGGGVACPDKKCSFICLPHVNNLHAKSHPPCSTR
jgi:hypothetical protein